LLFIILKIHFFNKQACQFPRALKLMESHFIPFLQDILKQLNIMDYCLNNLFFFEFLFFDTRIWYNKYQIHKKHHSVENYINFQLRDLHNLISLQFHIQCYNMIIFSSNHKALYFFGLNIYQLSTYFILTAQSVLCHIRSPDYRINIKMVLIRL